MSKSSSPTHIRNFVRKLATCLGATIVAVVFVAGFIAYFVTSIDPQTHVRYDGFGRVLSDSPFFARMIFGQERLWAGWSWFIGDFIIFWGGLAVGAGLVSYGSKD